MFNNLIFLFLTTLIFGTFIALSSNSFFGMWMGLEINLLSFIPLMSNNFNTLENESMLKYFLIQSIGSSVFLFSSLLNSIYFSFEYPNIFNLLLNFLIISALLFKMGAAPFHNWMINILEGMSWFNSFLILTWQKIAPLFLILYCKIYVMVVSPFIILSALIGAVGGLNQVSLRKILVFSSINHMAWILTTLLFNKSIMIIYYIIYFIINLNIVMMFKKYSLSYLNQMFSVNNTFYMYVLFMIMFSLAGLPPFTGFISKWLTLELLSMNNYFFLSLILILSSLITLFYYLQIYYSSFLLMNSKSKILFYSPIYLNILFIITSVISIFGLILILIFI